MPAASLTDRGVVRVVGDDARSFLDGLVTSEMDRVAPGHARYAALLTPQGKILFDFLVAEAPEEREAASCSMRRARSRRISPSGSGSTSCARR